MKKAIGIDIGGTKINAALIDEKGNILESHRLPTQADRGRDIVISNIKKLISLFDLADVSAIGIGSAGFIDSENGIIKFSGNIEGRTGLNLKKAIEEGLDLPVFIENDANIALECERWIGSGKDFDDIVMITLGTGLGGAVYNPKMGLLKGSNCQGAELGHIILHPGGFPCTCGQKGCAESYLAGSAISKRYFEKTGTKITSEEVMDKLDSDPKARETLDDFVEDLAYYLTSLRNIFDPQLIIIGGGFIDTRDKWWDGLLEKFYKYCNRSEKVKILPAKYLNDAGMIGAGRIALERLEND